MANAFFYIRFIGFSLSILAPFALILNLNKCSRRTIKLLACSSILMIAVPWAVSYVWSFALPEPCDNWCADVHINSFLLMGFALFLLHPTALAAGIGASVKWLKIAERRTRLVPLGIMAFSFAYLFWLLVLLG